MSNGTAIVVMVEHENPPDRGRMAHALNLASELKAAERPFRLIFAGKSVDWLPQLLNPNREEEHPFVRNYGDHFDAVRDNVEACNFCCIRFGALEKVRAAGIPIRGEGKGHMKLSSYIIDDWDVVTF